MYNIKDASNARKKEMQEWEIHRKKQEKPSDLEQVSSPLHYILVDIIVFLFINFGFKHLSFLTSM